MSDFIRKNPFTSSVIFFLLLLTMFFFAIIKPSIEIGDSESRNYTDKVVFEYTNPKLDSILFELRESNYLLKEQKNER